ncbi:OmpA family protein [Clostridium intestinale]|uniref:Chemotaxis protein MotB n=1 Tax=Clostridium intestinale DSM 6191 TaxID=1121320 RepID=A0A1M5Y0D3_9CLOT|nr:OmpA family protein [Clostridium intestinale]SHI05399.1 chemotaxis protein MotB [Clostridium intestinale DSM 6191]
MAREKKPKKEVKTDAWLATYGDMVTLVLTFFVLMYSFSSVNEQKLKDISIALTDLLGGGTTGKSILDGGNGVLEEVVPEGGDVEGSTFSKVSEFLESNGLEDIAQIKTDDRGVIIELNDKILFESGKSELIPESREVLDKISGLLATLDNTFIVEGHTDNVPIDTYKFNDNWDLSSSRANSVIRYFTKVKGLDFKKFNSAAYGEFKPLVDNSTEENRAKNRRVNILIVATEKENKENGGK